MTVVHFFYSATSASSDDGNGQLSSNILAISINTGISPKSSLNDTFGRLENKTEAISGSTYWTSLGKNRALAPLPNSSRFNLDHPYSMSSADAGFLADDLSYKLFSVNFFRVPLGETTSPRTPKAIILGDAAIASELTLNSTDNTSSHFIVLQGHTTGLLAGNLTAAIGTPKATHEGSEIETMTAVESGLSNITIPPDFQVVTFGSMSRGRAKSAGQLLPPMMPGTLTTQYCLIFLQRF